MITRRKFFLTGMLFVLNVTVATGGEALRITANIWPPYVDDRGAQNNGQYLAALCRRRNVR